MKSSILLTILLMLSSILFAQSGFVYTYYSSGKVEGVLFYASGVLEGTSYWYHENGNLKAEKTYSNGRLNGFSKEFDDTGLMMQEISVKSGVRDGLSRFYYPNGALKSILSFEKGELIKQVNIDNDPLYVAPLEAYKYANTQERIKDNEDLFICEGAEICPKPVGGMNEIIKHLVYPEHAKLYGLEGFVTVVVSVDSIGIVTEIDVLNDLGLGTKEAALEAVKTSRFLPGEKDGKSVSSKVLFKIPFMLDGKILYATSKKQNAAPEKELNSEINSIDEKVISDTTEVSEVIVRIFECDIDICPKPKKGIKGILDNLILPPVAKRLEIKGEIIAEAVVDIYGNVRDTKILEGLGYGCDDAVEAAIFQTEFEPGVLDGNQVRSTVKIRVPIIQIKEKVEK
jgi:TonB family protein